MKELGAAARARQAPRSSSLIRKVTVDKVLPEINIPGKVIQTSLDGDDRAATHRSARGGRRRQRCLRTPPLKQIAGRRSLPAGCGRRRRLR